MLYGLQTLLKTEPPGEPGHSLRTRPSSRNPARFPNLPGKLQNLQPATKLTCFFSILNLIWGDSGNSESGVGLGWFFHVDWCRNYVKIWSGGRFYEVVGDGKHILLVTPFSERNY